MTTTSNASGVSASFAAPMSTIQCSFSMSEYSLAISSKILWKSPSVTFMMLSLVKQVTFFTKDNIMKLTDGLFHKIFDEIAAEYTDIENEHWIVDIGAAKLADTPEAFDVVVMPNLYGDVLSDVAAQIAGSVGLAGSANVGENIAMFEAIHGS